jgi:hypothetical protein
MNTDDVKIITGVRRSGKTHLIKTFMEELINEGIPQENIIYISLETGKYRKIKNDDELDSVVYDFSENKKGKLYMFFDEIHKHLKSVKTWNIERSVDKREWVSAGFHIPMNETIYNLLAKPLKLSVDSYKVENLYIDIHALWVSWREDRAKCYIELMLKGRTDIIVRCGTKIFKPEFNGKKPDITDNKVMINGVFKPALKNIFKPALKDIDTLIEFMTTQHD